MEIGTWYNLSRNKRERHGNRADASSLLQATLTPFYPQPIILLLLGGRNHAFYLSPYLRYVIIVFNKTPYRSEQKGWPTEGSQDPFWITKRARDHVTISIFLFSIFSLTFRKNYSELNYQAFRLYYWKKHEFQSLFLTFTTHTLSGIEKSFSYYGPQFLHMQN